MDKVTGPVIGSTNSICFTRRCMSGRCTVHLVSVIMDIKPLRSSFVHVLVFVCVSDMGETAGREQATE